MATRTYNPSVRVGNWIEDVQLEEVTDHCIPLQDKLLNLVHIIYM